ncbi:hypothetical protein KA005_16345, partial [bacterium]|nr:hypothetical protein [bacterium]
MLNQKKTIPLKIGYMPLVHKTYWRFFPYHEQPILELAKKLKDYLTQFGTVCETGKLIDCMDHAKETRLLFQAEDVDAVELATTTYSTSDDVILDLKSFNSLTIEWNTQKSVKITNDLDFDKWMYEHGITGVPG